MPSFFRLARIALIALSLSAGSAHGQTHAQLSHLFDQLKSLGTHISNAQLNLLAMADGLPEKDSHQVWKIIHESDVTTEFVIMLRSLISINLNLQSAHDRDLVLRVIKFNTSRYLNRLDAMQRVINRYLVGIKSPAAISEATKIRDAMQNLISEIQTANL